MCQEEIGKGANTVFIAVYVLNAVNSNRLEQFIEYIDVLSSSHWTNLACLLDTG